MEKFLYAFQGCHVDYDPHLCHDLPDHHRCQRILQIPYDHEDSHDPCQLYRQSQCKQIYHHCVNDSDLPVPGHDHG